MISEILRSLNAGRWMCAGRGSGCVIAALASAGGGGEGEVCCEGGVPDRGRGGGGGDSCGQLWPGQEMCAFDVRDV